MPEEEEKQEEIENLYENMMEQNFLNLVIEIDMQVQEAQRVPNKLDPRGNTPRHYIIKYPRLKIRRES